MYKMIVPDFVNEDERGKLVQLVHDGWRQVNVVMSAGGTTRGGHYHKNNREAFYIVSGSCDVTLEMDGEKQTARFTAGDFFAIEPYTVHTFRYLKDTLLVGLYDNGVDSAGGCRYLQSLISSARRGTRRFADGICLFGKAGAPC